MTSKLRGVRDFLKDTFMHACMQAMQCTALQSENLIEGRRGDCMQHAEAKVCRSDDGNFKESLRQCPYTYKFTASVHSQEQDTSPQCKRSQAE